MSFSKNDQYTTKKHLQQYVHDDLFLHFSFHLSHRMKKNKIWWFTLIEIMLAMTVFAGIMTAVLLSIETLSVTRVKTENRVKLLEELYFFNEKLISEIKNGGTLDFEEYWNRKSLGSSILSGSITAGMIWWTYIEATGVGNYGSGGVIGSNTYGDWLYYCLSGNASKMWTGWCLTGFNNPTTLSGWTPQDYTNKYQRFGEYNLQFIDYNYNADNDGGDEDGMGWILDDEDDRDIGNGPIVLSGSTPELYLTNPTEKTRVFFRYIVRQDPGTSTGCVISATGMTNEWCMWNVQVLKMNWLDIGYTHSGTASDGSAFDGKVDTWVLHPDWSNWVSIATGDKLATGTGNEWVDLFPNSINVKSLRFNIFPQKDPWLSWSDQDCNTSSPANCISPFIHPYVRLQMSVWFSWGKRRVLKNDDPTISINTTINLGYKD